MSQNQPYTRALFVLGVALCVTTFFLIVWGGHVNTTRSGMAFPDWPTSNAVTMMTYAPSEWLWQSDRFWEHGHRLLATVVGALTVGLLFGIYRTTPPEQRPTGIIRATLSLIVAGILATVISAIFGMQNMPVGFMESFMVFLSILLIALLIRSTRAPRSGRMLWLALAAFVNVCLQGMFGGYTVRNNLPDWASTTHGMLAETFFMTIIGITMMVSRTWQVEPTKRVPVSMRVRRLITITWVLTLLQFFLGALTRHTDAWGASVAWPEWSDSAFLPSSDLWAFKQVVIHFTHRSLAYAVALLVCIQAYVVLRNRHHLQSLVLTSVGGLVLVFVQIYLGVQILFTARGELATTLHVLGGVGLLVLMTLTLFNAYRLYAFRMSETTVSLQSAHGGVHV
jgi:heme a synthase